MRRFFRRSLIAALCVLALVAALARGTWARIDGAGRVRRRAGRTAVVATVFAATALGALAIPAGVGATAATARAAGAAATAAKAAAAVAPQTTQGTDFWLTFEGNYDGESDLYLFAAGDTATSGTVSEPGISFSQSFTVTPGTVTQVQVPTDGQDTTSDTVGEYAIHVTAQAPVSIYGLNTEEYTTDGFLGLPTDILGQHYIVEAYTNDIGYGSQFSVVGTVDGTTVTIDPSETVGDHTAGTPYTVQLNQGQTYQLNDADVSNGDLTGTDITSNQPVAVFGGSSCADVPSGASACNTLTEELTPVTAWGTSFVTEPLATRSGDTFRFLASADDTTVQVNGTTVATLNADAFYETTLSAASVITSNNPIFVTQFSNSSSVDGASADPFSVTIPPYGQFLNSYTVTTEPDGADPAISANYINVVAPTSEVGSVTLDGTAIPASDFTAIPGSSFSGAQVPVNFGSHVLGGPLPFGITVYGYGDYDGYGYPGGFTLSPIATVSKVSLSLGGGGTAPVGGTATATATVTDQNGNPIEGVRVDFTVTGANAQTGFAYTDASGDAVFTYTGTNAGTDTITAAVQSITSSPVTQTWTAPAPTTVTTKLSAGQTTGTSVTVPAGTAVTDSATLSGANAATATGSVTYNVYADNACTKLVQAGAAQPVSTAGTLPASAATTLDTAGTYYWQASYSGDSANEPSLSSCGSETETVTAAATSVTTSLSGGGKSGTSITVPAGTAVTDAATLSGAVAASATGSVTYNVYSDSACTKLVSNGMPEPVTTPGTLPGSTAVTLATPGTYYWQASYSGDASDQASVSSCGANGEVETVSSVAASTSVATSLAGGGKAGTAISVPAGTSVTDSATLSGANAATASGTITYGVYANSTCTTLVKSAGSVTIAKGSVPASTAVTLTTAGTYYWQATYSGDSLNNASSSTCGASGEVETVTAAPTTLATTLSGGGKSGTAISVPAGTSVTDSGTLSGAVASAATGTVTYTVYSDSSCTKPVGGGTAQPITTPGTLPASAAVPLTTAGTYYWTASYSGDASNQASSSSCGAETVTVSAVAAPTQLATTLSGGGKSGTAISVPAGTSVTDSATLSGTNAATATGSVTYNVYSDSACKTMVQAGTAEPITKAGTLPTSTAVTLHTAGTYYWQVAYSGDANNQAADTTCGAETVTATAVATTLSTSLSGGGKTGTAITVQAGTPVTDSATLSGALASGATGTVTYRIYSNSTCTTLAANGGTESVSAGKATSAAVALTTGGTYYWTASYSGDASDLASASSCGAEKLTITPLPSIDTLTTAWGQSSAIAKVSTNATGDLVVAFVASTGPGNKQQSTTVSGGGLTWHLISRQNPGGSDTEVWEATASGKLAAASVTAKASIGGYDVVISMVTFKNASGVGPESFSSSAKGTPHGTLTTTTANTWVFAIGADWVTYAAPTASSGQLIVSDVNAPGSKTVWLQATDTLTATSGTSVTISDTKPTTDPYDLLLVGIH